MAKRRKNTRRRRRSLRGLSGSSAEHAAEFKQEQAAARMFLSMMHEAVAKRDCATAFDNYERTVRSLARAATHAGISDGQMMKRGRDSTDGISDLYHAAEGQFFRACKVTARPKAR